MVSRKYPHFKDCKCGSGQNPLDKQNEWHVNAPEYDNCFFVYIRHNAQPHTLKQIAELLGCSISNVTSVEQKALNKLRLVNELKLLNLKEKDWYV